MATNKNNTGALSTALTDSSTGDAIDGPISPVKHADLCTESVEHAALYCCRLSGHVPAGTGRQESIMKANGNIFSEACFQFLNDCLEHP